MKIKDFKPHKKFTLFVKFVPSTISWHKLNLDFSQTGKEGKSLILIG